MTPRNRGFSASVLSNYPTSSTREHSCHVSVSFPRSQDSLFAPAVSAVFAASQMRLPYTPSERSSLGFSVSHESPVPIDLLLASANNRKTGQRLCLAVLLRSDLFALASTVSSVMTTDVTDQWCMFSWLGGNLVPPSPLPPPSPPPCHYASPRGSAPLKREIMLPHKQIRLHPEWLPHSALRSNF